MIECMFKFTLINKKIKSYYLLNIPLPHKYIYGQGLGILFRSGEFLMLLTFLGQSPWLTTSALLRGLQKMAASKPIYCLCLKNTSLSFT